MKKKIIFPEENLIKTNLFDVSQDWEVPIPGFFIIAPLRKIKSFDEFTDEESREFIGLIREVRKGMRNVLNIKEVYFFQNEDSKKRFHLWIFPRYKWMDKFGKKIQSVRPIIDYSKEEMIREDILKEVKESVRKMRKYLSNFQDYKFLLK